jgi:hypothetical protein
MVMRNRINFYLFLIALIALDAVLIRSPNLIGKIGLWFYKYHYLRTFPKALLTVCLVVGVSVLIAESVRFVVKKELIKRLTGQVILLMLTVLTLILLTWVIMDFSEGSYSHTGIRFKFGAYLLPAILVVVFVYTWITLPRLQSPLTESPMVTSNTDINDN